MREFHDEGSVLRGAQIMNNVKYMVGGTPATYATAGAQTYTAADILSGIIVRDCAGASRSDVLPTAALLMAEIRKTSEPVIGQIIKCLVINGADAAEVLTIGAGSGGTFETNFVAASRVIGQNSSRILHLLLTGVAVGSEAYVVYM